MSKNWTMKEIETLKNSYDFMTEKEIAEELGRSVEAIHSMKIKLGLCSKEKRYKKGEKEAIFDLYRKGYSYKYISAKFKRTKIAIRVLIYRQKKEDISFRENFRNKRRPYSKEEIEFIKNKYSDIETKEISVMLGRTTMAIETQAKLLKLKKSEEHIKKIRLKNFLQWKKSWC